MATYRISFTFLNATRRIEQFSGSLSEAKKFALSTSDRGFSAHINIWNGSQLVASHSPGWRHWNNCA